MTNWNFGILPRGYADTERRALIILNQPFSLPLLAHLWKTCRWRCCADGGANQLYDMFKGEPERRQCFLPELIKGDLDSIRDDVRKYYASQGVPIIRDDDQDSTDLMKCVQELCHKENAEGMGQWDLAILGGLSGRFDQTVHTLSYLHKLRKVRRRTVVVTDEDIGWVLDAGEHFIEVNHNVVGPTCGLLPIGVESTVLTTKGLRWNLTEQVSSFDGLVSTSNHLVPDEGIVYIKTSKPIWWTMALKPVPLQ